MSLQDEGENASIDSEMLSLSEEDTALQQADEEEDVEQQNLQARRKQKAK